MTGEARPAAWNHAAFLRRLEVYRSAPELLAFDHELAGVALAIGVLVGAGFPDAAALSARAAELAWPDRDFPWKKYP